MKPPYQLKGIPNTNGNRMWIRACWNLLLSRLHTESIETVQTKMNRIWQNRTDQIQIVIDHYKERKA